jgi:CHAT domain-containing protein/tetratricopeptide (TPR) repeat protein
MAYQVYRSIDYGELEEAWESANQAESQAGCSWEQAYSNRKEILEKSKQLFGQDNWKTLDAKIALDCVSLVIGFSAEKQAKFVRSQQRSKDVVFLFKSGDYTKGYRLAAEISKTLRDILPENHPHIGGNFHNLGVLSIALGDFPKARKFYRMAKAIRRKELGANHPSYAKTVNNMGYLAQSLGDFANAQKWYKESMLIRQKVFGTSHYEYAQSLNNLAGLYLEQGKLASAEPLYLKSTKIREEVLSSNHPVVATSFHNLGTLYRLQAKQVVSSEDRKSKLDSASKFYRKALTIRRTAFPQDHSDTATTLAALGALAHQRNSLVEAREYLERAEQMRIRIFGANHPDVATSVVALANCYMDLAKKTDQHSIGQTQSFHDWAVERYQFALTTTRAMLEQNAIGQSERQQLAMNRQLRYQLDRYIECCLETGEHADVVQNIIAWKGAITLRQRSIRKMADDPRIAREFAMLEQVVKQLSNISFRQSKSGTTGERWSQSLRNLTVEKERLETEISDIAKGEYALKDFDIESIQNSIPEQAVLICFLEFKTDQGKRFVATVLKRDGSQLLRDIGDSASINQDIDLWRASFGMSASSKQAGQRLRAIVWEPILPSLGDARNVLISADGVLGRLPFAALPGKMDGSYLIESYRISMIPIPRLIPELASQKKRALPLHEIMLMGGIDYDWDPGKKALVSKSTPAKKRRLRPSERAGSSRGWKFLNASVLEVDAIASTYLDLFPEDKETKKIVKLQRESASESAFRSIAPKSTIVHLATHGFFAAPEFKSTLDIELISDEHGFESRVASNDSELYEWNPGQLSGLVFAGANFFAKNPGDMDSDDGILTSDEIASLPLDSATLAVLSACDTGLGEVAGGEGLLGVQRAFQVSGVDSTISTLWSVNDSATQTIMTRFYKNYLDKEMGKLDALREAQIWALRTPDEVPRSSLGIPDVQGERLSPKYWAPFILSGDWR